MARFLAYRHSFPIGQLIPLDSYITSDPFVLGSLIALMMEAARTSETSVNIQLRTWQYIPKDSELHTRCRENLKSHRKRLVLYVGGCHIPNPLVIIKSNQKTGGYHNEMNFKNYTR
jgi:hypothetical protein